MTTINTNKAPAAGRELTGDELDATGGAMFWQAVTATIAVVKIGIEIIDKNPGKKLGGKIYDIVNK